MVKNAKFKPNGDPIDVVVPGVFHYQQAVTGKYVIYRKVGVSPSGAPNERALHQCDTWEEVQEFLTALKNG